MMMPHSVKLYILREVQRWVGIHETQCSEEVMELSEHIRPFIVEVEKQGNEAGWNGATKRRMATARIKRDHPEYVTENFGLAVEVLVRALPRKKGA